jgi:dihydroflavonol-4-reductase
MAEVLVLGAGGFLGLNIVRAFLAAGVTPRAGRRPRGNVLGLRGLGVPLVPTDFGDPASLREAFAGVEVLVHAAAHYPRFSHEPEATYARGEAELGQVLEAAKAAGVRRVVYVSSTATVAARADGKASTEADVYAACPDFGTYHALKWRLEQRAAAAAGDFELSVLCPAACIGPYDWKVGTSAMLLATAKGVPPPHPAGRITTVDARDVGDAVVLAATRAVPPARLIVAGENHDAHALFELLARRYGAPPPPAPLGDEEARVLADRLEAEAAQKRTRSALSRELVDLIVHAPAVDAAASRALGLSYRPLTDTLDAWEAWAQRMGLLTPPRTELSA